MERKALSRVCLPVVEDEHGSLGLRSPVSRRVVG